MRRQEEEPKCPQNLGAMPHNRSNTLPFDLNRAKKLVLDQPSFQRPVSEHRSRGWTEALPKSMVR
jgi:hypothetical protein